MYYLKAHEIKEDRANTLAYIQGYYYSEGAFIAITNAMRSKKDSYNSYLSTISILPRTEEQVEQLLKEKERLDYENAKTKLKALASLKETTHE